MNDTDDPHNIPDWFWEIIARAENSYTKLYDILSEFDYEKLNRFAYEYEQTAGYWSVRRFRAYMYRTEDSLSEDSVWELTRYIVGKGKDYFMDIWNHPEHMPADREYGDLNLSPAAFRVAQTSFQMSMVTLVNCPTTNKAICLQRIRWDASAEGAACGRCVTKKIDFYAGLTFDYALYARVASPLHCPEGH